MEFDPATLRFDANGLIPAIAQDSSYGHEDFRIGHAALVAPGSRTIAERFQRAGMRIGTQLALVAGHRVQLPLKRLGDVDHKMAHSVAQVERFKRELEVQLPLDGMDGKAIKVLVPFGEPGVKDTGVNDRHGHRERILLTVATRVPEKGYMNSISICT